MFIGKNLVAAFKINQEFAWNRFNNTKSTLHILEL